MNKGESSKFPITVAQDDSRFYLFHKGYCEEKNDKVISSKNNRCNQTWEHSEGRT